MHFVSESDGARESPSTGSACQRPLLGSWRAQASDNFVGSWAFPVSSAFCENQLICLNSECFSMCVMFILLFYFVSSIGGEQIVLNKNKVISLVVKRYCLTQLESFQCNHPVSPKPSMFVRYHIQWKLSVLNLQQATNHSFEVYNSFVISPDCELWIRLWYVISGSIVTEWGITVIRSAYNYKAVGI